MNTLINFLRELSANLIEYFNAVGSFFTNHFEDLILNLISEAVGIIVTILIIDRLIKGQEIRRWKPATGQLLSDLLNITDELIFVLLPKQLRKISSVTYKFGNSSVTTAVEIDKQSLRNIVETICANINYYHSVNVNTVDDVHKQLEYVLRFSGIIMQPVLFDHLLSLDRSLGKYKRLRTDYRDSSEKSVFTEEFTDVYLEVLTLSVDLRDNLIDQADSSERGKYE